MHSGAFRTLALVLAAYMMAVILPALAAVDGSSQSGPDHARMMAMAGDMAPMDEGGAGVPMALCQQHCLLPAAKVPVVEGAVLAAGRPSDAPRAADRRAASRADPPSGPPPRVATI